MKEMTRGTSRRMIWAFLAIVAGIAFAGENALAQSTGPRPPARARIEGRVVGPDNRPVQNVRISVLNDGYSPVGNFITDAAGRFQLTVGAGNFYIDAEPGPLPYERQRQRIELDPSPFSAAGEIFRVDIVLVPSQPRGDRPAASNTGVVFYQEVPKVAQKEFGRAEKLLKGNKSDEAIVALKRAIELYPDYYLAMEALGAEYVKSDQLNEAYPVLSRALEVNPNGSKAHYAIGVLYYKAGKHSEATASFRRSLELDPASQNTLIYLGLALMRDGKSTEAEDLLEKAYEKGARKVPELHLGLASLYMKDNRYREAITAFERLLSENPELRDRKKIETLIDSLREKAKAQPKP